MKKFEYAKIEDKVLREYIKNIADEITSQKILKGKWEHFTAVFTKAESNRKIPHKLGFKPLDVITTSSIGAGSVTFNYSDFDKENLDLTSSGVVTIRFYVGNHQENDA